MAEEQTTFDHVDRDAEDVGWRVRDLLLGAAEAYRHCNPVALLELSRSGDLSHHTAAYLEDLAREADATGLAHIRAATYLREAAALKRSHLGDTSET
ncbi:hypothetical protein [Capsulimonas corticalis]|nr:hypothetical protein [Capsulimonas corticalis]